MTGLLAKTSGITHTYLEWLLGFALWEQLVFFNKESKTVAETVKKRFKEGLGKKK